MEQRPARRKGRGLRADDWTQLADNDGELTVALRRAAAD